MQVFMCILNIPGAIFSGGEMDLDPGETTKKTNQIDVGNQHQSPIFVSISSTQIPVVIAWNKHSTGYWTCHHPKLVIRDSHHSRDRSRPVCFCLLILTFVSTCFHQAKNVWISPDRPTLKKSPLFQTLFHLQGKKRPPKISTTRPSHWENWQILWFFLAYSENGWRWPIYWWSTRWLIKHG